MLRQLPPRRGPSLFQAGEVIVDQILADVGRPLDPIELDSDPTVDIVETSGEEGTAESPEEIERHASGATGTTSGSWPDAVVRHTQHPLNPLQNTRIAVRKRFRQKSHEYIGLRLKLARPSRAIRDQAAELAELRLELAGAAADKPSPPHEPELESFPSMALDIARRILHELVELQANQDQGLNDARGGDIVRL
jgi:hypothetical protein